MKLRGQGRSQVKLGNEEPLHRRPAVDGYLEGNIRRWGHRRLPRRGTRCAARNGYRRQE
jgi:hypothetical protein